MLVLQWLNLLLLQLVDSNLLDNKEHQQHGMTSLVDRPTTFGGIRMGEGIKPGLVTVTPLTWGTGNHTGPTVSSGTGAGGRGGPIVIENIITLYGHIIDRRIRKVALDDFGMQV